MLWQPVHVIGFDTEYPAGLTAPVSTKSTKPALLWHFAQLELVPLAQELPVACLAAK